MSLYGAIDLHGNNNVTMFSDEADQIVYQKRLTNQLPLMLEQLAPFQAQLQGIVVESTFNWYWLVDGLMEAGYQNPYLSWAYAEAAYFAIRFQPQVQRYYQRKLAQSKVPVARKAVAHKLARACYYIMQKQEPFNVTKAFG